MNITIYDVFELNRVLHSIIEQQSHYAIGIAFKIHSLIKWLDDTETFVFERLNTIFGVNLFDANNPSHMAILNSQIPFIETSLTIDDLLDTNGVVDVDIKDISILEKLLHKTED